ncbi:MAG: GPR endopeptidase [Lachnospiraceae bacterium]|nr:GPR endopeptidase [Lachnospiraceae bacterium]
MKRTDLALEEKESIEGNKEIAGVVLEQETMEDGKVKISKVEIKDKHGSEVMRKPMGSYITIETKDVDLESMKEITCSQLKKLFGNSEKRKIMVVGLGNREITPDALGPKVIDQLFVTRHLIREFGKEFQKRNHFLEMCALAPGVMAQTGMESREILQGIIKNITPDVVIVIDALAARNVGRVNRTIQITDTGICPGAGVGNNRKALNKETLGVEVIAIGVPTVVDAETIVEDRVEESLLQAGFSEEEVQVFLKEIRFRKEQNMFVTTKDVDEEINKMSEIISEAINQLCCEKVS